MYIIHTFVHAMNLCKLHILRTVLSKISKYNINQKILIIIIIYAFPPSISL